MRRPPLLATALALLLAAALLVPTAQAKTYSSVNRFFQEDALNLGGPSVLLNVVYRNTHRDGRFTPRVVFIQFQVPVSCQVGGDSVVGAAAGPFKLRKGKVEFGNSYFSPSFSYGVAGHKNKDKKKKRIEGIVTVFDYSSPPTFILCTGHGPYPFVATPCQWDIPPNKPSLPFCQRRLG